VGAGAPGAQAVQGEAGCDDGGVCGVGAERIDTDKHIRAWTGTDNRKVRDCPWGQWRSAELAANGALSLLNVCCHLLDRQLGAQASAFEREGGFTERLYRVRSEKRSRL